MGWARSRGRTRATSRSRAVDAPLPERVQEPVVGVPARAGGRLPRQRPSRRTGARSTSEARAGDDGSAPISGPARAPAPRRRGRDRRARPCSRRRFAPGETDRPRRGVGRQAPVDRRAHRVPTARSTWSRSGSRSSRGSSRTGPGRTSPSTTSPSSTPTSAPTTSRSTCRRPSSSAPPGPHDRRRTRAAAASSGTCRPTCTTSRGPRGTVPDDEGDDRRRRVTVLYPPGCEDRAERELATMRFALPHFGARYGRYPYSVLTVVHPPAARRRGGRHGVPDAHHDWRGLVDAARLRTSSKA